MRLFGLIGKSLGHSFSQQYFNEKFQRLGLADCNYELFEIPEISNFPGFVKGLSDLQGLNVTIPYKRDVISYLSEMDEMARKVGAVNTISFHGQGQSRTMKGWNTDVLGFERCLRPLLQGRMERALVLGTGGAAAAVVFVLQKMGIQPLQVTSSNKQNCIGYEELNEAVVSSHFLIINTTPLGQFPDIEAFPEIPYFAIGPGHVCIDLVYNPSETLFMRKCKEQGALVEGGLSMLYAQAEAAWNIWSMA